MGSVALGLGEVGSALQQAKALKLKEQMDAAKLAVDQGRLGAEQGQLGVSQQYASIAAQRQKMAQAEFEERQRVAKLPKFVGFRTVGGKLYYGVQDPTTGQVSTKEVTGVDSAQDAQGIEESIQALPPEAQAAARATVVPYLQAQDYPGARGALKPILQQNAKSRLPGQATVSSSTSKTDPFTGATTTSRKTQKVPAASTPKPPPTPKVAPPMSPAQHVASIRGLKWDDVAPSPAYYSDDGKPMVPRASWSRVDEVAKSLRDGATKVPAITLKNFQLWTSVMARARELGWSGGPPPTTNERDAAQWARKALPHLQEVRDLITSLDKEGKLGPLQGRWSEFMAGKVGTGPEFEKLRANLGLMTTALMRQHVGARGGTKLLEHFEGLWNAGRMDAPTLNAGIDVMESFMRSYATLDVSSAPGGGDSSAKPQSMDEVLDSLFPKKAAGQN